MGKALVGTRNGSGETVATGQLAAAPMLTTDQEAAILDALDASRAKATERVYKSAWGRFISWADAQGYAALPAAPETVAAYLASRAASGLSPASMKLDRAAIRDAHRSASRPDPTQHPGVANVARGIVRTAAVNGHAPRQVAGLTSDALAAIRATARLPRRGPSGRQESEATARKRGNRDVAIASRCETGPSGRQESEATARKRGNRDVAIASTMRDGLLRRSEAAALAWGDIELRSDGTGRLTIRRSKTDQAGEGSVQFLGKGTAAALRTIRPKDAAATAKVFGVKCGRSIARRLSAMAKAAGLDGHFGGHSGRVGMARDLVAAGASVAAVQIAGRWASSRMPAHYARGELAARGAVAKYYGG